jgi:endoglucanase
MGHARSLRSSALRAVLGALLTAGLLAAPAAGQAATGYFHTRGAQLLDEAGRPVRIAGVNWFGFETPRHVVEGLGQRDYKSMLDQMASEGYNTVRLPFSNAMFDAGATASGIDYSNAKNADLAGRTPIQIMDRIIGYAGSIGLKVILDRHLPGAQSDVWYSQDYSEQRWIDDWKMLAQRYAGDSTVVGADLDNEPHGRATWGDGNPATDWRLAAERAGNAILSVNPSWLILVEGVECVARSCSWWGGNLENAGAYPVRLDVPGRLVYSPHEYANDVYRQAWFSDPTYPSNLPPRWDKYWGYLFKQAIAPVLIGEFGTKLDDPSDTQWLTTLTSYMRPTAQYGADSMSWAFWAWNPTSSDTGGLLYDDWQTVNRAKDDLLDPIKFTFPGPVQTAPAAAPDPPPDAAATPPATGGPGAARPGLGAPTPPRAPAAKRKATRKKRHRKTTHRRARGNPRQRHRQRPGRPQSPADRPRRARLARRARRA